MFIELVDALRCPSPHEETWLVAASRRMAGRSIVEGTLGCPICRREFPIAGGVAYFGVPAVEPSAAPDAALPGDDDAAFRLAALLDLVTPGGTVVLGGTWGRLAPALAGLASVHCLLLDPPGRVTAGDGESVSVVRSDGTLPLAPGVVRGVALDQTTAGSATVRGAARALAARGRLVAPASVTLPPEVAELARDDAIWVAERLVPPSAPVSIDRGRRR